MKFVSKFHPRHWCPFDSAIAPVPGGRVGKREVCLPRSFYYSVLGGLVAGVLLTSCDESANDRRREVLWPPPSSESYVEAAPEAGGENVIPQEGVPEATEVNPSAPMAEPQQESAQAAVPGVSPEMAVQTVPEVQIPAHSEQQPSAPMQVERADQNPAAFPLSSSEGDGEESMVGNALQEDAPSLETRHLDLLELEEKAVSEKEIQWTVDSVEANPALNGVKVAWLEPLSDIPLHRVQRHEVLKLLGNDLEGSQSRVLDSEGQVDLQKKQILQCIQARVPVIVVYPVLAESIADELQLARRSGIYVVVFGPDPGEEARDVLFENPQREIGTMLAHFLIEALREKSREENRQQVSGHVVLMAGPEWDENSQTRLSAVRSELAAYPGIVVVHEVHTHWSYQEAGEAMADALRLQNQIDVVLALNDYMAVGAEKAVRESGRRSQILVIGVDGVAGAQGGVKKILDGQLDATIRQPLWTRSMASAIRKALVKTESESVEEIESDLKWITRQNAVESMHSKIQDEGK